MSGQPIPGNFYLLHDKEEDIRQESIGLIESDDELTLHLFVIMHAMNMCDMLRKFPTEDEDIKAVQILSIRIFNAFGSSIKLALSGYIQNSALIMRDILETVFLLDLFRVDPTAIERWRFAKTAKAKNEFRPVNVRKILDDHYKHKGEKRREHYNRFSELAGHPTNKSVFMLRPKLNGNAVIGPFCEVTTLGAVLAEAGRLAVMAGETQDSFFPETWREGLGVRAAFSRQKKKWRDTFFPTQSAIT